MGEKIFDMRVPPVGGGHALIANCSCPPQVPVADAPSAPRQPISARTPAADASNLKIEFVITHLVGLMDRDDRVFGKTWE